MLIYARKSSGLADKRFLKRAERVYVACFLHDIMPVEMKQLLRLFFTMRSATQNWNIKKLDTVKINCNLLPIWHSRASQQCFFCSNHIHDNIGFHSLGLSVFYIFMPPRNRNAWYAASVLGQGSFSLNARLISNIHTCGEIDWVADGRLIESNVNQKKAIYSSHTAVAVCWVWCRARIMYVWLYPKRTLCRGSWPRGFSWFQMWNWGVLYWPLSVGEARKTKGGGLLLGLHFSQMCVCVRLQ